MRVSPLLSILVAVSLSACTFGSDVEESPAEATAQSAPAKAATSTSRQAGGTAEPVSPAPAESIDVKALDRRLADATAEARVTKALVRQDRLRIFDFEPSVDNGTLVLRGDVNTVGQYKLATQTAERVAGVDRVENRVTVAGQPHYAVSDETPSGDGSMAREAYYTVRSGDTLWKIARDHRASVQRIKRMNDLSSASLQPGQRIRVR